MRMLANHRIIATNVRINCFLTVLSPVRLFVTRVQKEFIFEFQKFDYPSACAAELRRC